jgi:hypothetical protein
MNSVTLVNIHGQEPEFCCTNCDGSGYFDMPDGSEKACSVCHGKGAYTTAEIEDMLARLKVVEAEVTQLRGAMDEIAALVSWHIDTEANPLNTSPEDMTAHINGLVWQIASATKPQDTVFFQQ